MEQSFCESSKADLADDVGDRVDCEWKVILPNTQSIKGLYRVSQLYPRTTEHGVKGGDKHLYYH